MDKLDLKSIDECIKTNLFGRDIVYFEEIDSTNNYAKEVYTQKNDGAIIVSETQTSGRGRQGNVWVSQAGVGIWMSVIIKPIIEMKDVTKISSIVGLAVRRALEDYTGLFVSIKWPNDIIINKKKVCGVLVESIVQNERVSSIIIGIGVNVNQTHSDFPKEISHASSLRMQTGQKHSREEIICTILQYLEKYYNDFMVTKKIDIKELKDTSVLMEKPVIVTYGDTEGFIKGKVTGFLEDGSILINDENNKVININSSKASIRGITGYLD